MTLTEALRALEEAGREQIRAIYLRHVFYAPGMPTFGVTTAEMQKLKRRIKTDHGLARELWATGNLDARILATLVADPKQITPEELDRWAREAGCHLVADALVRNLVSRSAHAAEKAEAWIADRDEFVAQAGWDLVAWLAMNSKSGHDDDYFQAKLRTIEAEIGTAPNRARYAMNGALIAIGSRSAELRRLAEAAAERIGPVTVDHGDTGCGTPDAIPYIRKIWDRAQAAR